MIGPVMITSESSIGAGTRRIEAFTGPGALALSNEHRRILEEASRLLRVDPEGLVPALDKLTERQRQADKELSQLRSRSLESDAQQLGATQSAGVVVARRDGLVPGADARARPCHPTPARRHQGRARAVRRTAQRSRSPPPRTVRSTRPLS